MKMWTLLTALLLMPCAALAQGSSAVAESSHVFNNGPSLVSQVYATNHTSTAGFLVLLSATTAPATGSSVIPLDCVALPASGTAVITTPQRNLYSTGLVAMVTSASTCFTITTGTITAFFKGYIQ